MSDFIEPIYGHLPKAWQFCSIGTLIANGKANLQTGPFGTALLASEYKEEGIPVLAVKHIGQNRVMPDSDFPRVDSETYERLLRYKLNVGDIVFGRKGAIDRRALITRMEDGWLQGSDCIRLRLLSDDINPVFVSYVLGSPQYISWVTRHAGGSTMPSLNQSILERVPLPLPPTDEQQAISNILCSLDDKIELNRRMNATLEEMARAIFQSWFVDFDPVHAKARGEQPYGMDAETTAMFPDSFEESALGLIPAGWRVVPIGEHVIATKGVSYKGDYLAAEGQGLPMHNLDSVLEFGGYKYNGIKWYSGEYKPRHIVRSGGVIVANTEQGFDLLLIGSPAIVPSVYGEASLFSHHIYKVEPLTTSPLLPRFIYHLINSRRFRTTLQGYTNGTTVNMLPSDALEKPLFVLPPDELITRFDAIAVPIHAKQETCYTESQTLIGLRDTLLPKLISGEIRVGEL